VSSPARVATPPPAAAALPGPDSCGTDSIAPRWGAEDSPFHAINLDDSDEEGEGAGVRRSRPSPRTQMADDALPPLRPVDPGQIASLKGGPQSPPPAAPVGSGRAMIEAGDGTYLPVAAPLVSGTKLA
jgi:hypothetical protein